ncbi:50S ribosomal protein L18e [Candidatus Woesearchaeota archaeon]|nr:50S ribosomal protein L18e [Candidatus Woesearchaeota archaeon]
MKRTGPTNPVLQGLIHELKKNSSEQSVSLWKRVAVDLERPSRQRRAVNLSRINRFAKENEVIVVPGKVLGTGTLSQKLTIAAYQFSKGAKEKIEQSGSIAVSLTDLSKGNPKGKGIRIMG